MAAPLPISGRQKANTTMGGTGPRHNEQPFRIQQKNLSNLGMVESTPSSLAPTPLGPSTNKTYTQMSGSNRRWADYTPAGVTPAGGMGITPAGQEHPTASLVFQNTPTPSEYNNTQGLSFSQIMGNNSTGPQPMSVSEHNARVRPGIGDSMMESGRNGYITDPPPGGFDRMQPAMVPQPHSVGQQLLQSAYAPGYQLHAQTQPMMGEEPAARLKVKNTFIDDYDSDEDVCPGTATHELGAKSLPVGLVRSGGPPGQLGNPLQYQRLTAQTASAVTAAVLNPPPGQMGPPLQMNQPGLHGMSGMWRQPQNIQPGMSIIGSQLTMPAPSPSPQQTVIQPYNIRQPQPSVGSDKHGTGDCRPCAWFWKPQGCANGIDCRHCHMCPEGELKNRKKDKVSAMRAPGR